VDVTMIDNDDIEYGVRFSEPALINLILNSLEAYTIVHKNKPKANKQRWLEVFGHLFGHVVEVGEGQKIFHVEFINTDTSSKQENDSVLYNKDAACLKRDIVRSFWPSYQYLGDFHTHPYGHYSEVDERKGFYLSQGDREEFACNNSFWKDMKHQLSVVASIGYMDRAGTKEASYVGGLTNCVEFTLGNYRIWLAAYFSYEKNGKLAYSQDNCESIYIDCPNITGFYWEHTPFGRVKVTKRRVRYRNSG
jgi:hypothetical protein